MIITMELMEKSENETNCLSNNGIINNNNGCTKFITSIEDVPAYCSRFSLCILDIIRKLQQHAIFEKGVEKCHIIEYLKHLPNMDGDISSQVMIALRDLEINGYIMHMKQGYKTIGPFAKLCMAKTPRQRRILWRKLDMKFNYSCSDLSLATNNSTPAINENNNNNKTNDNSKNNEGAGAGGDANNANLNNNNVSSNSYNSKNKKSKRYLRSRSETKLLNVETSSVSIINTNKSHNGDRE